MVNVITELKNEARAEGREEGREEGRARGQIAEIRRLVARGILTADAARAEIHDLIATGAIPREIGEEGLGQPG